MRKLKDKIESIRERVEASDYGIENSMAEYALVKVGMDNMIAGFKKAEIGTTMAACDMPYDETTILNESNINIYL